MMNRIYAKLIISLVAFIMLLSYKATSKLSSQGLNIENDGGTDSVALENEYVRVLHNTASCTSAHAANYGTRIIVALTRVKIHSTKGTLQLKRGEIGVFLADESYQSPIGEYFEIAIKTNHPPLTAPAQWIEPQKNKIVYDDDQLRVFEERLAGGDERPLHSHAQRIVIRLNKVQLTDPRFHPNALPGTGIQVPNTVKFAEPVVHVVRNTSKGPLFNVVIEFKVPHQ